MLNYVSCPNCQAYCPVPDLPAGQQARCPSCQAPLPLPDQAASSFGKPVPSPNKTVLAEPEAMIRYTCPKCKKNLESPASFAGQKLNCPGCKQRLQIPQPPPPLPTVAAAANKTVLATIAEPPSTVAQAAPSQLSVPPPHPPFVDPSELEVIHEVSPVPAPVEREHCLECGKDVTRQKRAQTCADCGSLFCSANCYREHRYHAHEKRKKKRRQDVECDFCGSTARPYVRTVISEGGWMMFVVLLIFFFPLCWIGLLMTESRVYCIDCNRRLD